MQENQTPSKLSGIGVHLHRTARGTFVVRYERESERERERERARESERERERDRERDRDRE